MKRIIIADTNALSNEDIKKLEAEGCLVIKKVQGGEVIVIDPPPHDDAGKAEYLRAQAESWKKIHDQIRQNS